MRRNFIEGEGFNNQSLDLHGMRLKDAIQAVENFIDSSLVQKNLRFKIIYGWGTGVLQKEIKRILEQHEDVLSIENPLDVKEAAYIVNLKDY